MVEFVFVKVYAYIFPLAMTKSVQHLIIKTDSPKEVTKLFICK